MTMFRPGAWNVPAPRKNEVKKHERNENQDAYISAIEACVPDREEPQNFRDEPGLAHFVEADQREVELSKKTMGSANDQRKSSAMEKITCGFAVGGVRGENAPLQLFGNEAYVALTNRRDDLKGLDGYVVFPGLQQEGESEIVLGIDFTMNSGENGQGDSSVQTKIENNVAKLDKGGAELRYFRSPSGEMKSVKHVIPVVIGVSGHNADMLIERCGKLAQSEIKHKNRALSADGELELSLQRKKMWLHSAEREVFLQQIKKQLERYQLRYTQEKNPVLNENIGKILSEIKKLIPSRREINMLPVQDKVADQIMNTAGLLI